MAVKPSPDAPKPKPSLPPAEQCLVDAGFRISETRSWKGMDEGGDGRPVYDRWDVDHERVAVVGSAHVLFYNAKNQEMFDAVHVSVRDMTELRMAARRPT